MPNPLSGSSPYPTRPNSTGYAHSITVYPQAGVPGRWSYVVTTREATDLGSGSSEAEAWRLARHILSQRTSAFWQR